MTNLDFLRTRRHKSRWQPRLELLEDRCVPAATITVNTTIDANVRDTVLSLREAILVNNRTLAVASLTATEQAQVGGAPTNADTDTIAFSISGAGVKTISPTSGLPTITDPVIIDGYTQPGASSNTLAVGNDAVLLIELNGTSAAGSSGLVITGGGSTVRGLVVNRFPGSFAPSGGIVLSSSNNVIAGNIIGLDPSGSIKLANAPSGVRVVTGANNLIGGTTPAARNVISGNAGSNHLGNVVVEKLFLGSDPTPSGTLIRGNYIGTNAAGTAAIVLADFGNSDGVVVQSSTGTIIGGSDADDGVLDGNVGARNVISGNAIGIHTVEGGITYAANLTIQGNFIGVDATGNTALGNFQNGIAFVAQRDRGDNLITIGGTAAGTGNVISGNRGTGVSIVHSSVVMQGNRIGTDLTGTLDLGNGFFGVHVDRGAAPPQPPVQITIGGTTPATRNIISGNGGIGLKVAYTAGSATVQGNYIGTQSDGQSPLGNGSDGIEVFGAVTIGGTGIGEGNVIARNGGAGVSIMPDPLQTQGNATVLVNSIFANTGPGIMGSTAPRPTLTSATGSTISGTLAAAASTTYRVEFFATPNTGPTSNDEGRTFLGFQNVTTNGTGNANFIFTPANSVPSGQFLTATATGPTNVTSNFSTAFIAPIFVSADLAVTKTDSPDPVTVGQNLTYTVTVVNNGPDTATNVVLTDILPAGVTFVSATGGVVPSDGVLTFDLGAIDNGDSAIVTIVVRPNQEGSITNRASVSSEEEDPNENNNTAVQDTTVTEEELVADLSLTKTVDNATPSVGQTVTFTITVTLLNEGAEEATGVAVREVLPPGLTFVSFLASQGSYDDDTGIWTVGVLNSDSLVATLVVTARVTTAGTKTNTAEVSAVDQPDPDSTPNNNDPQEDDQASTVITPVVSQSVGLFVTGGGQDGEPRVKVWQPVTALDASIDFVEGLSFLAYDASFRGGVRVATGDVNGDGAPDIITAPGLGGGSSIRVFDSTTGLPLSGPVSSFDAYGKKYQAGVFVAAGDVNGDGFADIITGPQEGRQVKVFSGADGSLLAQLRPYGSNFIKSVHVAAGDVNGDGKADLILGPSGGTEKPVKVFDAATLNLLYSFFPFDRGYLRGLHVAASDLDGDGLAEIIAGNQVGSARIKVFKGVDGSLRAGFEPFGTEFAGGVRVAAGDVNGDGIADFMTGAGPGQRPGVRFYDGATLEEIDRFFAADLNFRGGIYVSAFTSRGSTSGRPVAGRP